MIWSRVVLTFLQSCSKFGGDYACYGSCCRSAVADAIYISADSQLLALIERDVTSPHICIFT